MRKETINRIEQHKLSIVMTNMQLKNILSNIKPIDSKSSRLAQKRWDSIAKPLHSLGLLEDAIVKMAGIYRSPAFTINKKALAIFCSDNGIVSEGVTQTGSEVTAIVSKNFVKGETSAAIMAFEAGIDLYPVDIGIAADINMASEKAARNPLSGKPITLLHKKISYGTKNMLYEPAMTKEQALQAISAGFELAGELKSSGYQLLACGEMGIGNTTTSSAVVSALLGIPPALVTGKGAGLSSEGFSHKIKIIEQVLSLHKPDANDPIDILSKVGGYDLAGLTGLCIGAAYYQIPVILDGFITEAAALMAVSLCETIKDYILPSHVSKEPAGALLLETLQLKPFLTCEMCLGEGTGAAAAIPILNMAHAVYEKMSTFQEIQIEDYKPL